MSASIKSEGFNIRLVLPANTSMDKVTKKILRALPKGTNMIISPRKYSLQNKESTDGHPAFACFHEEDK